jgi:phage FluMu protein Com
MTQILRCDKCGNHLGEIESGDFTYLNVYGEDENEFAIKYLIYGEIKCAKCKRFYNWNLSKKIVQYFYSKFS